MNIDFEGLELLQGDCLDTLKILESDSINTIVTSPPYNKKGLSGKKTIGNQLWKKFNIDYNQYDDNMPEKDYQEWMVSVLNEMFRIIKPNGSLFFNHKPRRHDNKVYLPSTFIEKSNFNLYQLIIWNRKSSPNIRKDILLPNTEHIYWLVKGKPKVFKSNIPSHYNSEVWQIKVGRQKEHPAPFPLELVETCINLTTEKNDLVLDPFMGSGTTGVACVNTSRNFIGIEIDKKYFDISLLRIKKTQNTILKIK